jgi:hypothetical protein
MKRITILFTVLSLLLLFAVVPAVSEVQAAPPIMATGTINAGNPTSTGVKMANGNTFLIGEFDQDSFTGTFSGTAPNVFSAVINPSGLNVQIYYTFTGTVNGKSGTLTIKFQGNGEGIGLPIQGKMVILSGTGDLANLHGVLDIAGVAGAYLHYTGMIHFDPK